MEAQKTCLCVCVYVRKKEKPGNIPNGKVWQPCERTREAKAKPGQPRSILKVAI